MSSHIKYSLLLNLKNIPGWRTNRKIVVIECDDWGGIRMPSKEVFDHLLKEGVPVSSNRYNRFDTIEEKDDLELLFEVLNSVKDSNSRNAVMTPVTIVANPDFRKIKESGFTEYHFEKFTDTYINYGRGDSLLKLWKEGLSLGIFIPGLHGRDHIAVQFWLRKLREGNKNLLKAFDNQVVSVEIPGLHPSIREFRPEFYFDNDDQLPFLKNSISGGAAIFRDIFDYTPQTFVPGNSIFHPSLEEPVSGAGIKFLNVGHFNPVPGKNGEIHKKRYITGHNNGKGLTYYIRNCAFEPCDIAYKGTGLTLTQVAAAFRWHKPAFISTHRVNFTGGISKLNRDKGLTELIKLLSEIVSEWPDVEFLSADEALEQMSTTN
jgi:hypothetical protein